VTNALLAHYQAAHLLDNANAAQHNGGLTALYSWGTVAGAAMNDPELAGELEQRLRDVHERSTALSAAEASKAASQADTPGAAGHWTELRAALGPAECPEQKPAAIDDESPLSFLDASDDPVCLGRLGPYRVLEVLGEGGMGIVLKAEEPQPRRLVAIKVMRPDVATPSSRKRFLREGQALASVEHERIVPVYRVDEIGGVPFLVMPLLQGESLRARLQRAGPPPLAEVLRIGGEIAEGLDAAHAAGVIHRDVKPTNIWLRGAEARVVLLDFGLARPARDGEPQTDLTTAGSVLGTVGYMAPEQAAGQSVDARADLFSLGCVLYELTTGERAFTGPGSLAILCALAEHHPPPPKELKPDVPAALSALIVRLLAKLPADRPQNASAVVTALRSIEEHRHEAATTVDLPGCGAGVPPAKRPARTRHLKLVLATGLIAAAVVLGALGWIGLHTRGGKAASNNLANAAAVPVAPKPQIASSAPLRAISIDIEHFERFDKPRRHGNEVLDGERIGLIGEDSYHARMRDQVTIEAKLSRPGYAYLLAFLPDGEIELCWPEREDQPPGRTDRPSYPSESTPADVRYGLTEGTGWCVFAVLASDEPLPAYRDYIAQHKLVWSPPHDVVEDFDTAPVWWYDGEKLDRLAPPIAVRGKGDTAFRVASDEIVRITKSFRAAPQAQTIAAKGFYVGPELKAPVSSEEPSDGVGFDSAHATTSSLPGW
jgi:hypothetical protein